MISTNYGSDLVAPVNSNNSLLPEILRSHAEKTPDKVSYIFLTDGEQNEEVITCKQLYDDAIRIAVQLQQLGAKGERVLMLFSPGMEFIKAVYACFMSGAIAVPAYPPRKNRSLERIRTMVKDSGATIILSTTDIYASFERSFSDLIELKDQNWILTDNLSVDLADFTTYTPLPEDIALLQYTSGSTGTPKGVMVTHCNIIRNLEFLRQVFNLTSQSISVSWLPIFHDMGLIEGLLGTVYNNCLGVLMAPVSFIQKPVRWLSAITRYHGTHAGAPNFAFDLCVDGITPEERNGLDLSSIETLYSGAEPVRRNTLERFINTYSPYGITPASISPCYGMAETTLIISGPEAEREPVYLDVSSSALENNKISVVPSDDPDVKHLVGVGHPWLDTKVKIVNPDKIEECKKDEVGEIWVSGSIVTAGYWNNPEVTWQTYFVSLNGEKSKYLRTGDLGFFHDNELYITGRLKDMIILQGRNFYPQDIEYITEKSHPAIRPSASAAFSVDINNQEKLVIVAEVERTYLRNLDVESVCSAIRQSIYEEFEQPVYAIQLLRTASIPKTSSGKIQRKACMRGFIDKSLDVAGESVPEVTASEKVESHDINPASSLAWLMLWVHLKLNVEFEKIDVNRNIAEYGLNSLKAMQLQEDILQKYEVDIPPYNLFNKITIKGLSEMLLSLIKSK